MFDPARAALKGVADAWLLVNEPWARRLLKLEKAHLTRPFYLFVPAAGAPYLLAHALEAPRFGHLEVELDTYAERREKLAKLGRAVERWPRLAAPYSPAAALPALSRLDLGTAELLRGLGAELVSDALVALPYARWDARALALHQQAARALAEARDAALAFIARRLPDLPPSELEVQAVLIEAMREANLAFDHPPIVAFGAHAADPHYVPEPDHAARLKPGDAILIDLWGRLPEGPYADITWMAAWRPKSELQAAFAAVREAQKAAIATIQGALDEGRRVRGFELDRAARAVLAARGFGAAVRHRTGHNLGWESPHGFGTHLDDFETKDTRPLIPGLAFTVEPGVYPGPFGVRLELDAYLAEDHLLITTDEEEALVVFE